MIDIENKLFNILLTTIRESEPDAKIYNEQINVPSNFPCVTIVEQDNYTDTRSLPLSNIPVASNLMYEINVYSNKQTSKKQQCKQIIALIDDKMAELGFVRTSLNPIQNLNDATIYRMVARYTKLQTIGGI